MQSREVDPNPVYHCVSTGSELDQNVRLAPTTKPQHLR